MKKSTLKHVIIFLLALTFMLGFDFGVKKVNALSLDTIDTTINISPVTAGNKLFANTAVGLPGGKVAVVLREITSSNVYIGKYISIYDSTGTRLLKKDVDTLISPKTNDNSDTVNLIALADGNILIHWHSGSSGKNFTDTYFMIIDQSGEVVKSATKINNLPDELNRFTRATKLSNGNIAFVWATNGSNYAYRIFTPSGEALGDQISVTLLVGVSGSMYTHEIASNNNGSFMMVFNAYNYDTYKGVLFNNDGTLKTVGGEKLFDISSVYKSGSSQNYVIGLSNGNFLVAYKGEPVDVASRDFRVSTFSAEGTKQSDTILEVIGNTAIGTPIKLADGGYMITKFKSTNGWLNATRYNNDGTAIDVDKQITGVRSIGTPFAVTGYDKGVATFITNSSNNVEIRLYGFANDSTPPTTGNGGIITPSNVTQNSIVLNWTQASDVVTATENLQYKVVRSNSNNLSDINTIEANGTNVSDWLTNVSNTTATGLTAGTNYYFNIIVKDEAGNKSIYNGVSQATLASVEIPLAPTNLIAVAKNESVDLTWQASLESTSYKVYKGTSTGNVTEEVAIGVVGTSYTVTGLTNGVTYYFVVKASNIAGNSSNSNEASAEPCAVPEAPTNLTTTAANGRVTVKFTAPANDGGSVITGYKVKVYSGTTLIKTVDVTKSPAAITGLTNGTAYTFTVSAVNSVGEGTASVETAAVTPSTIPGAVTGVVATVTGSGQVTVSFTPPDNNGGSAITQYIVTSDIGGITVTGTGSPIVINGLTSEKTYKFVVKAKNGAGTSTAVYSNSVTISN